MLTNTLKLGAIVGVNSHPFFAGLQNIVLSGEPTLLPPLMVVTEILFHRTSDSEIDTVEQKMPKQVKCIWYSNKSQQFEEDWFVAAIVKCIGSPVSALNETIAVGDQVSLTTLGIELGKKKSTLTHEETVTFSNGKKTTVSSLLTFLSPVLIVIQVKSNEKKKKIQPNIEVCEYVVKCKWFNPRSDKYSEAYLPLCAVQSIANVNLELLSKIQSAIEKRRYFLIKQLESKTIVKPNSIVYRSGKYLLKAWNYLANEFVELEISDNIKFLTKKSPFESIAPVFDFGKGFNPTISIKEAIEKARTKSYYIRIEYKNQNDKFSTRTLMKYKVETTIELGRKATYITGFCLTKKAERSFHLGRIQQVQVLKISFSTKA